MSTRLRALERPSATTEPEGTLVLLHGRGADEHDLFPLLDLREGRPRPAAIIALSGFVPIVPGFSLDLDGLDGYPVAIAHGSYDPVIPAGFGHEARDLLTAAGAGVFYRETPTAHTIDPVIVPELAAFVRRATTTADTSLL